MTKFLIPKDRIPKPFNQNIMKPRTDVDSCVACTFTKILEVINYLNTGKYIELSKGYMYGRNNYPNKKNGGMQEKYTLNVLLERGTVPLAHCLDYGEIPDIVKTLESRKDITELDLMAQNHKLNAWENLSGNNAKQRFENIKKCFAEKNMPLAVTIKSYRGRKHCVVAVGYDGDKILFQDHDGTDNIYSLKYTEFSMAFYLDGLRPKEDSVNMSSKIKPLTEINDIVLELTNAGIITNGALWLKKCEEDINVYWLCRKIANKLRGTLE